MGYYLSIDTIQSAYRELTSINPKNASLLHIFLILKGVGFNKISLEPVSKIAEDGYGFAGRISTLFSPKEKMPDKYNFINPFEMSSWQSSSPSESLRKWVSSRIKNNVIGGATTWRRLVSYDTNSESIKFSYDYVDVLKELTLGADRIGLLALAVWANRFTAFELKTTLKSLATEFVDSNKLDSHEINELFHTKSDIKLEFSRTMHDASKIREIIGNPPDIEDWVEASVEESGEEQLFPDSIRRFKMPEHKIKSINLEKLIQLAKRNYQVLLSGPPGTSKSYLAAELADGHFQDKTTKIQFHPQYSYQDFIGGYSVVKDAVEYRPGIMLNILDRLSAKDYKEEHLLIIDEINRANVPQVFGETIQCLDRNFKTQILVKGKLKEFFLPEKLYIIATMNTSDRTIGSLDFAVRRRFSNVYCPPNPELLIDLCPSEKIISLCDFLRKINEKLFVVLKNKDLSIGHSFFLDKAVKKEDDKYHWTYEDLEALFNYKILPLIEEYCHGNSEQILEILGEDLPARLQGREYVTALKEFVAL